MTFLRWLVCRYVPYALVLFLVVCGFMWLTCSSFEVILELWPAIAILCVPAAGMIAANEYSQQR